MSFLNLGSRSPCRYQNISTIVDPQVNKMQTAKNTFSGRGGVEGNTNELIIVTRTTIDVHPPRTRWTMRSRAEVSPNRGLLSRPPLVPYVLLVKSSMSTNKSDPFSSALPRKHCLSAAFFSAYHWPWWKPLILPVGPKTIYKFQLWQHFLYFKWCLVLLPTDTGDSFHQYLYQSLRKAVYKLVL